MTEKPYLGTLFDLGVLFVHGIVQSKEGDTLAGRSPCPDSCHF
jgi:hypothetical protein